jgi:GxxExxY protein
MEVDVEYLKGLRRRVIGCAIEVHRRLGPGLLESAYRDALVIELRLAGFDVQKERRVAIEYRGEPIGNAFRLDIVVEGQLVVEVKAVERIHRVHVAQVLTYLKLANLPCGLLMNFNVTALRLGVKRLLHPDLFAALARDAGNEENPVAATTSHPSTMRRRGGPTQATPDLPSS